jgi:hypothetical protein
MRIALAIILGLATGCLAMDDWYQHWRYSRINDAALHSGAVWSTVGGNKGDTFVVSAGCNRILKETDFWTFLKDAR